MKCILLWSQLFVLVSSQTNSHLLEDLISYQGYQNTCNIITCNENDSINLIKMLSARFQRFGVVHNSAFSPVSHDLQNFILDLRCPEARTVLQKANDSDLFRKPYHWLLLGDGVPYNFIHKNDNSSEGEESWFWTLSRSLNMLVDSDVKVIESNSDERVTVTGVYNLNNISTKESLAEWSPKDGLTVLNPKSIAVRRWSLKGVTFRSTIVITSNDSLNHLHDMVNKHIDTTTKIVFNMVDLFGVLFDARINYKPGNQWGILVNGSWTGMTGDLERKEIDFGANPLFIQKARMRFIEYFAMVTPSSAKFIFLSPSMSYSRNIFLLPFDSIVWCCCIVMTAASCFLLYIALNYETISSVTEEIRKEKGMKASFTEILVINIGAICLQGTAVQTKSPSARIITLFLYLSYMFLYISYSAAIVALLQSSDTSIQTLRDFQKSKLKAGAEDVGYNRYYFKNSNDEIIKDIYNQKLAPKGEPDNFVSIAEGVRRIQQGFYAFCVETNSGYYLIQKTFTEYEKCALQELKESFVDNPWIVMMKGSPYAEHFKIGMKLGMERGFSTRFMRRYNTKKPVCISKSSRFASVGILDCFYSFMLLSCGWITSFLIFLLEISFAKYVKIRRKHDFPPQIEFLN